MIDHRWRQAPSPVRVSAAAVALVATAALVGCGSSGSASPVPSPVTTTMVTGDATELAASPGTAPSSGTAPDTNPTDGPEPSSPSPSGSGVEPPAPATGDGEGAGGLSAEEAIAQGEFSARYDARFERVSTSGNTSTWRITNIAADDDYRVVVEPEGLAQVDPEFITVAGEESAEVTVTRLDAGAGRIVLRSAHRDDDLAEEPLP